MIIGLTGVQAMMYDSGQVHVTSKSEHVPQGRIEISTPTIMNCTTQNPITYLYQFTVSITKSSGLK